MNVQLSSAAEYRYVPELNRTSANVAKACIGVARNWSWVFGERAASPAHQPGDLGERCKP